MDNANGSPLLPGRGCGGCTLCCKVLSIEAMGKPAGTWCRECAAGSGCRIYDRRPGECRDYFCAYLTWAGVPEAWKPAKSKIVLDFDPTGRTLRAHVDPARPDAWRAEPYYSQLKAWARVDRRRVIVIVRGRAIVVLPDRDVDLGVMAPDEVVVTEQRPTPAGAVTVHVYKTKRA